MANRSKPGSLTMQVKASQMCLRRLLTADTLCQQPPDDTLQNTNIEDGKREILVWKKCIALDIKSTPTSTPLLRSLIMNNISLCALEPAQNQQLSVLPLSPKQNPTLIVSTTTSHCRRGQMSYHHIQYGFCLYYFLLLCPSQVFQNQIEKSHQKDILCFVYNHFIEKSLETGSHCCCNDISAISAVAQNRIDIIQLSLRSQEVLGACVVNGVYH